MLAYPRSIDPFPAPHRRKAARVCFHNQRGENTMSRLRFIDIDGKRYFWRDILHLRREQKKALARAEEPALFELKDDHRPVAARTAEGRYREPSLFSLETHGRA